MLKCTLVPSPNFTDTEISVECIVIHYTATSLARTLEIFADSERKVSAHLVIDRKGEVYEVVRCISGPALRAWHAGISRLAPRGEYPKAALEGFNDFSIGIELVNVNGNVFPYTEAQYQALIAVLQELRIKYPGIQSGAQVVGHEEIAGFRGKCDPGRLFDWERVLREVFPNPNSSKSSDVVECTSGRSPVCTEVLASSLSRIYTELGVTVDPVSGDFVGVDEHRGALEAVSSLLEAAVAAGVQFNSLSD